MKPFFSPGISFRQFAASRNMVLITCLVAVISVSMGQDFLRAGLYHSGYYFSESFMFSSFWWLFIPLGCLQGMISRKFMSDHPAKRLGIVIVIQLLHLFVFPLFLWILSGLFYYHQFAYLQTLMFTLSEHGIHLALIYPIPVIWGLVMQPAKQDLLAEQVASSHYVTVLEITEGTTRHLVQVGEILYISANTPYITIHLRGKRHLLHESLKSITGRLDPAIYTRVHKSCLVNITRVSSYTSRLNGDYDLTMDNGAAVRLSRHFAAGFKQRMNDIHRVD
ncbi:MAG: LytTR family transcriptional regulator [Chitinophagaceae bacterium]|nr:MAG: LytTR family transcriptional regulator [Chitinophagaceae bacterium]